MSSGKRLTTSEITAEESELLSLSFENQGMMLVFVCGRVLYVLPSQIKLMTCLVQYSLSHSSQTFRGKTTLMLIT